MMGRSSMRSKDMNTDDLSVHMRKSFIIVRSLSKSPEYRYSLFFSTDPDEISVDTIISEEEGEPFLPLKASMQPQLW
jgi:hypothetical protein